MYHSVQDMRAHDGLMGRTTVCRSAHRLHRHVTSSRRSSPSYATRRKAKKKVVSNRAPRVSRGSYHTSKYYISYVPKACLQYIPYGWEVSYGCTHAQQNKHHARALDSPGVLHPQGVPQACLLVQPRYHGLAPVRHINIPRLVAL